MRGLIMGLLVLLLCVPTQAASAKFVSGRTWHDKSVPVYDYTNQFSDMIKGNIDAINDLRLRSLRLTYHSKSGACPGREEGGITICTKEEGGSYGTTLVYGKKKGKEIVSAKIVLVVETHRTEPESEKWNTVCHELMHALGFNHTTNAESCVSMGETWKHRTIGAVDERVLHKQYDQRARNGKRDGGRRGRHRGRDRGPVKQHVRELRERNGRHS